MPQPPNTPAAPPRIETALPADQIIQRLDTAARRGRLPGFHAPATGGLFEIRDFGTPFESRLVAVHTPGHSLELRTELLPRLPVIFLIITIVSIWPGVWLVESFVARFGGEFWRWTWHWYMPLSIISGAWAMWATWKKSKAAAAAEAPEIVARITKELGE